MPVQLAGQLATAYRTLRSPKVANIDSQLQRDIAHALNTLSTNGNLTRIDLSIGCGFLNHGQWHDGAKMMGDFNQFLASCEICVSSRLAKLASN